jgi:hypothetical protein
MRRVLYNTLTNDAELQVFYPANKFYESGAVEDSPAAPFAVIRWGTRQSAGPGLSSRMVQVYFHDARGSYDRINDAVARCEELVAGLEGVEIPYGTGLLDRISTATWQLSSGELFDTEHRTNVRYVEFRMTGRDR